MADPPAAYGGGGAIVDLCDSDDDEVLPPSVARMPSPRSRNDNDDDDSDVEVVDGSQIIVNNNHNNNRKRRRGVPAASLKRGDDDDEVIQVETSPPPKKKKAPPPPPPPNLPLTPLESVLQIFPDVALDHAKKLLKQHNNIYANVVNALLEEGSSYPKEPGGNKKVPSAAAVPGGGGAAAGVTIRMKVDSGPTYDFMNPSSFQPTQQYKDQSIEQLMHLFPCLTKSGTKFILNKSNDHLAIAHDRIVRFLKTNNNNKKKGTGKAAASMMTMDDDDDEEVQQFKKLKACTDKKAVCDNEQKGEFKKLFGCEIKKGWFSTRPRPKLSPTITDKILIEEISFVMGKQKKWEDQVEAGILRKEARQISIKDGTALECACCYDQVAMDEMVQCRNEGHLFCQDCLSSYVENQIFSNGNFGVNPKTKEPALELLCFHGDECGSGFDRFFLEKALKEKVLERYDELQTQVNLEKAGLRGSVCSCPKCGYTAEVPETNSVFACPNIDCRFESCRKCREASHVPLRCDEVESKAEEDGRKRVEEAASAAVIRFCPSCGKGIVKSDGCNKMTCGCGTKFCYLCRKMVKDYSHFCQTPHCTHSNPKQCKGKCPLYTKDLDKEHEKNMREAALAEAAKVEAEAEAAASQKSTKRTGLFGDTEPQPTAKVHRAVDVNSILQAPKRHRAS